MSTFASQHIKYKYQKNQDFIKIYITMHGKQHSRHSIFHDFPSIWKRILDQ